ncbi:MAG TPA: hypothetical protein VFB62_12200 [Polyangiaceae bacterium]|nr:hypothetical protein [Polyangiaceae bacterium]
MVRGVLVVLATFAVGCGALLGLDDYKDRQPPPTGSGGTTVSTTSTGGTGGSGGSVVDAAWSIRFGTTGITAATSVAVAENGSIVVVGTFNSGFELDKPYVVSSEHIFVAKLDGATGKPVWSHIYDVGGSTQPRVATDPGTAIYITGELHQPMSFGGATLVHRGAGDIFLVALSEAGDHLRSQSWGTQDGQQVTTLAKDFAGDILVLSGGGILLCGSYGAGDTGVFGFGNTMFQSYAVANAYVVRLNSDFSENWVRVANPVPTATSTCHSLALGSTGLFAAGTFTSGIVLDSITLTGSPLASVFIASLDETSGAFVWASGFGSVAAQFPPSLAADGGGDPLLAGRAEGMIDYGGQVDVIGEQGVWLSLVSFLNSSMGQARAGQRFGTGQGELSVAADGSDVFVAGAFNNAIFGMGGMISSAGAGDVVVARMHLDPPEFAEDWITTAGDTRDQRASDLALDSDSVIVVGSMEGAMTLGDTLEAKGDRDAFVAKLPR